MMEKQPANRNKILRISLLVLLAIGITLAITYRDLFNEEALTQWVNNAGAAAPVLFIIIYALAAVLFLPGSLLTLAGGALFGPVWGTLYNLTGATIGATLSFLVSRYLAADWVTQKTGGRLKQLIDGVENEGWRFVAFTRLVPVFPFNLLNYALGLTRIPLLHYVLATFICMFPGGLAYTYLGYVGREALSGDEAVIQKILLALALLAVAIFLPRFIKRLRQPSIPLLTVDELRQRLADGTETLVLDMRSADEFSGELGHIKDAMNIPVESLRKQLQQLDAFRNQPIAIICHTDRRSKHAAQLLAGAGFTRLAIVTGGMVKWHQHDFPVEA